MAKHTQTIRRPIANELFEFMGLALKGLSYPNETVFYNLINRSFLVM